jgi:hypothetical protein
LNRQLGYSLKGSENTMDRHHIGRLLWGSAPLFVIAWSLASLARESDAPTAAEATTPSQQTAPLPELTSTAVSADGALAGMARGLPIISSRSGWTHDFFYPNTQSPSFRIAVGVAAGHENVALYNSFVPNSVVADGDYCCNACSALACNASCSCPRNMSDDVLLAVWRVRAVGDALTSANLVAKRRFGAFDHADHPSSTGYQRDVANNRFGIDVNTQSDGDSNSGFKIDGKWVCKGKQGNAWLYFNVAPFTTPATNDDLEVMKVVAGCGEINETASVDFIETNDDVTAFAGRTFFENVTAPEDGGDGRATVYDSEGKTIASFPGDALPVNSTFIIIRDDRPTPPRVSPRLLTTSVGSQPAGLALDASNNAFVLGTFQNDIDLGDGVVPSNQGSDDIYLAKYSPRGNLSMVKTFGSVGNDLAGWCAVPVVFGETCPTVIAPALSIDPNDGSIIVRGNVADGLSINDTPVGSTAFQLRLPPGSNRQRCSQEPCLTNLGQFEGGCFAVPQTGPQCTLPDGDSGECFQGTCQPIPAVLPTISILSATYGRNCGAGVGNQTTTLSEVCTGLLNCFYIIDYQIITDPVVGCSKDYDVQYQCGSDPTVRSVTVPPEAGFGSLLELSCN